MAEVVQLAERLIVIQVVAGSSPVFRPKTCSRVADSVMQRTVNP